MNESTGRNIGLNNTDRWICKCGKQFDNYRSYGGHVANCRQAVHTCICGYSTIRMGCLKNHQKRCKTHNEQKRPITEQVKKEIYNSGAGIPIERPKNLDAQLKDLVSPKIDGAILLENYCEYCGISYIGRKIKCCPECGEGVENLEVQIIKLG